MIVFPAIDIRNGKCVRLVQGDYSQEDVYGNPVQMAMKWQEEGAKALHLVDLDGALYGTAKNIFVIKEILQLSIIPVQIGGGIRSLTQIERLLHMGTARVILGTKALLDPTFVKEAVQEFGESIAVSIDAKEGYVATNGWTKTSTILALDFAKQLEDVGVATIIYTDIAKDGMLAGPNLQGLKQIDEVVQMDVIASGGITSFHDVYELKRMGLYGAIVGKALYTGKLTLSDVIE
ncbi:1-(5-phosphoribosyl)-5-[(5-phosphoribosylamino)methylideneamino]imidazole-4-carboxamide isomerase [Rubeoparvulum massiliense]|uniref:1-(5-phosphoribosyl)-5-[(5- phosphoribosylamino)methylideneamino]imidazole-4- carboxamide isomerase n=1 Tax=Rubeoparvulum massiliense TaxID=1631346 RepID=UPI00065DDDAB|nr:1-(5-phosphoribosyl)-5-[(5-phosphoribosylamino)methylideneamino]imidazole-4-carboxamide isomerase [Rubeoparvulum massiliense]